MSSFESAPAGCVRYTRPPGLEGVELLCMPDSDFGLEPHVHDAWVIWLTTGGNEHFRYKGSECILKQDSYGVVAPGEVHADYPAEASRTLMSFYVDDRALQGVLRHASGRSSVQGRTSGFRKHVHQDPAARALLIRLHTTLSDSACPAANQTVFRETFAALLRRLNLAPDEPLRTPKDSSRVRKAVELLRRYASTPVSLDYLAGRLECSSRHLLRIFKAEMGTTPHAYLKQLRLEQARALLADGESPLNAALSAGFADQSHLTRAFKHRFGLTPARYRAQVGPENLGPDVGFVQDNPAAEKA